MGVSKAALGIEVVPVRSGLLLGPDVFDTNPLVIGVSHVGTLRLSMLYTPVVPGASSFEFVASVSFDGVNFTKTTINNVGVLTPLAFGTASTSDVYVRRFRPLASPTISEDFGITLNRSVPFIKFEFAEFGALVPGKLDVSAMLS